MKTNTRIPNQPEEAVDRMVAAFFRSEMPAQWPPAPVPSEGLRQPARPESAGTDPSRKSRWALAASVALLVGSCWYLSGHLKDGKSKKPFNPDDGTATPAVIDKNLGKDKPDAKGGPIPGMP